MILGSAAATYPQPMARRLIHFFDLTPDALRDWCCEHSMATFRAQQVLDWVYRKGVVDPANMTNLSQRDRDTLTSEMMFLSGGTIAHQVASDGVQKLLIAWRDAENSHLPLEEGQREMDPNAPFPTDESRGEVRAARDLPLLLVRQPGVKSDSDNARTTECVLIPASGRKTACISSQVGCPVGCHFCASGLGGLEGNLSAGRIVEQVWRLGQLEGVGRVSNVVFMGMGEPLANLGNVEQAIRAIAAPWGMGISARKITVSTVGLPQAIERFAASMDLPVTLALSLHAPTDELRRQLIPWAKYSTIEQLVAACTVWFDKTGREITLEYTLLAGVNDSSQCAAQLAQIARHLRSNVNLIRYNEVEGLPYARPRSDDVRAFQAVLRSAGVNSHIRASRGRDIAAACGQLRRESANTGATGAI